MFLQWPALNLGKLSGLFVSAHLALAALPANAASITIAPDSSAINYIPLSLFGISPLAGVSDESFVNLNVPSYTWAGQSWNRIGIVSNGYAIVGGATAADVSVLNTSFPNASAPANVLAPFWTNLDPGAGGGVYVGQLTDGVRDWLVIDWANVPLYGTTQTSSFEIWIGLNGVEDITFSYGDVALSAALTIGAQDRTGTVGATYYYNGGPSGISDSILRVSSEGLPSETPIPGALPLFATGLGAIGLASWRRKRRAAKVAAQS